MHRPLGGFSPDTFRRRRERALAALGDGVLVLPAAPQRFRSRDTEYRYRPDSELFYLTGVTEADAVAVLRPGHDEPFVLFVRERDADAELWSGERLGPEGARERFAPDAVHPLGELEERLPGLLSGPRLIHYRLGAEPRTERIVLEALARGRARGSRQGTGPRGLMDPGEVLDDLRLIKDAEEVERIRRAAAITVDAFRAALARVRPGVGEWEIEAALDGGFRASGADGAGYDTIVGSGRNACVLHYVDNGARLEDGQLVLVDAGAALGLYHADVTRTFPASGAFDGEQRAVYEVVEAARAAAVAAVRPGATIAEVHAAATGVITAGLEGLGVHVGEEGHKPFYPHQTSHWIGLDVHDPGDYARAGVSRVLEPGMVLTVEPGLYFRPALEGVPEGLRGIGARVEDDVLVTESGAENLTAALPTDADGIAALVGGIFVSGERPRSLLLERLRDPAPLVTVEMRPPRSGLDTLASMDVWIDLHHSVRRLLREDRFVFVTDNAVGAEEEENLAHLAANLGQEVDLRRVVPFLTCKHTLEYCLMYAARAASAGVEALAVLGGDRSVGAPRCLPHAYQLRALVHERVPGLVLGGWANPHRPAAEQVDFLSSESFQASFYLTQVVSHHSVDRVEALLAEQARRGLEVPGVFGVFFYRSANPDTLARLGEFFPVPAEALTRDFAAGASAEELCARTIRELRAAGATKVYVSNLGFRGAAARLERILERV